MLGNKIKIKIIWWYVRSQMKAGQDSVGGHLFLTTLMPGTYENWSRKWSGLVTDSFFPFPRVSAYVLRVSALFPN